MNVLKNFLGLLKQFLGFPPAPTAEQVNEILITQRESRDCHVPVVAITCGNALGRRVSYEEASRALWHWNLPWILESPILSNPLNVCRAIRKLGCKANDKAKISELLRGELAPGKTICLVHNPSGAIMGTLQSHWICYMGQDEGNQYLFHWGLSQKLRVYNEQEVVDMLTSGFPNVIISVEKA
jgi:hypothetical protein